jgi:drug/metabolite transporter (DMT)-like permease
MAPWSLLSGATLGMLPGYGLLLGASLAWSIAILVTRRHPPTRPVLELLPWCFALGALLILPLALWRAPAGGLPAEALWHGLFVGCVAAPIGTWATIEAGRRLSGVMTSIGFLLIPAMGVIVSHLWLGEALGWDIVLGGLLIGASVVLAARG